MSVGKFCHVARGTRPPLATPSSIRLIIPLLLRDNAVTRSARRTWRRSTSRGTLTPCRAPRFLIHEQRLLWMCAAIMPTVSRGIPGTGLDHTDGGRCSTRYAVARLFVRHAATSLLACRSFVTPAPPPSIPECPPNRSKLQRPHVRPEITCEAGMDRDHSWDRAPSRAVEGQGAASDGTGPKDCLTTRNSSVIEKGFRRMPSYVEPT
jgi:hypothetical protein